MTNDRGKSKPGGDPLANNGGLRIQTVTELVLGAFRDHIDGLDHLPPESLSDIERGIERAVLRWHRWLTSGNPPERTDYEPLRMWAAARARDGVRLDQLVRAMSAAGQRTCQAGRDRTAAWDLTELMDTIQLVFGYVDELSAIVIETYLAEQAVLVAEEERQSRELFDALSMKVELDVSDLQLASRLDVPLKSSFTPFAIVLTDGSTRRHADLAARLRRDGWPLSFTEGNRVEGLTWPGLARLRPPQSDGLLVTGAETPRPALPQARRDVEWLVDYAHRRGQRGTLRASDHLLELLIARSPGLSDRLQRLVLGQLSPAQTNELLPTLQTLFDCSLDRGAACAELHIHRNTLAYRLRKVEALTGIDLSSARGITLVYVGLAARGASAGHGDSWD